MIVRGDVPLSELVWYRIGGPARYLLDVRDRAGLLEALAFVERHRPARLLVIGDGSNLVFPDERFDGAVIQIGAGRSPALTLLDGGRVEVFGGDRLDDLTRAALAAGLVGLEWAGGLPGTVGAAVRGNVGAFGGEISHCLREVEIVDLGDGPRPRRLERAELGFAYRASRVKREPGWVVAQATLQLRPAGGAALAAARATYRRNVEYRRQRHPLEYPSCGSVFKNVARQPAIERVLDRWPELEESVRSTWHGKIPMGLIVGRLGLAGLRSGGAEISRKHHNFIVNRGGARAADVRELIGRVEEAVERYFGFVPELEIELVEPVGAQSREGAAA